MAGGSSRVSGCSSRRATSSSAGCNPGPRRRGPRLLHPPDVGLEDLGRPRDDDPRRCWALRPDVRMDAGPRPRPLGRPRGHRGVPRLAATCSTRPSPTSPRPTPTRTSATSNGRRQRTHRLFSDAPRPRPVWRFGNESVTVTVPLPRGSVAMAVTVVRYRTKPDRADENQALIEKVFAELDAAAPPGLRYASFRLDDGVSFVHVAEVDTDDGTNPLTADRGVRRVPARDRRSLRRRSASPSDATLVGSYQFAPREDRARGGADGTPEQPWVLADAERRFGVHRLPRRHGRSAGARRAGRQDAAALPPALPRRPPRDARRAPATGCRSAAPTSRSRRPTGTVEAWARADDNPVGGWYGLKKGLRGRFGNYVPPVMEQLGLGRGRAQRRATTACARVRREPA